jgi:hypothetical protein
VSFLGDLRRKSEDVRGLGCSLTPLSSCSPSSVLASALADRLCFGCDAVMGASRLDGFGRELASWAWRMRKSCTALRWKVSSGCAALLSSVSFEVGAMWRDGRGWLVRSASNPLEAYQS